MTQPPPINRCLFCGGDATDPEHLLRCDGRQGQAERLALSIEARRLPDFDGETYDRQRDHDRLNAQLGRVLAVLRDGAWHTLGDIEQRTGDEKQSISARIRDLRKPKFGGFEVERRYLHDGLWEYRLVVDVAAVR